MPVSLVTNALSWTTVSGATVVIALWLESWTSVRTVASAHSSVAGREFAPRPSVFRVSGTPPTVVVTCALTTVVPGVAEATVTWQLPVPPVVLQGSRR